MREGVALVRDSRARSGLAKLARRGMTATWPTIPNARVWSVAGPHDEVELNYKTDGARTKVLRMHA
jgi:hypothetical protein